MFALMKLDYHRLREPAVVYSALCLVVVMLVGTFFLDTVSRPRTAGFALGRCTSSHRSLPS